MPYKTWRTSEQMLRLHWLHTTLGADHTGQFRHHPSASLAVIVRKVVGHHLFLSIIPNNFTVWTEQKVWVWSGHEAHPRSKTRISEQYWFRVKVIEFWSEHVSISVRGGYRTELVEILVFRSSTGYMLASFFFSSLIWGIVYEFL